MGAILQDLRIATRSLRKSPGFTTVVVLTLALGIGANAAIFSVLNAVLLRPLPYPTSDRIMTVWTNNGVQEWPEDVSSYPNFADWRAQNTTFVEMAGYTGTVRTLTGAGEPEQVRGAVVLPTIFEVLAATPARGRTLIMEDFTADRRVVVISDAFWNRRFGADPAMVGRSISLNGIPHEVVGIMPEDWTFPSTTSELWLPFPANTVERGRGGFWMSVIGRLKPDVTIDQARAELNTIAERLAKEYPATNEELGVTIIPLHENIVGDVRPALLVLMGAVGFVLLIACANVANLLLARGAGRTREVAVRAALGAGRARIVRQLLSESVCLAIAGGALGVLMAKWGVDLLVAAGPAALPRMEEVRVDGAMMLFALGASLLTAVAFGLPPALRASSVDLSETLKDGSRSMSGSRGGARLRRSLVVSEIAIALMLMIGAGLLFTSFRRLSATDAGFRSQNLLTARVVLPASRYPQGSQGREFFRQLLERAKTLPGVVNAGYTTSLPLNAQVEGSYVAIEGRPPMPDLDQKEVRRTIVSPDYFQTLGMRLIAGRAFGAQEVGDTVTVAVINETMKKLHFLDEDPIGRRLKWGCLRPDCPWVTVIGVTRDAKQDALDEEVRPEVYVSYLQLPRPALFLALRTEGDPLAVVPALRSVLQSMDRDLPLASVVTMDQLTAESVATRRFNATLLGIFSALALTLALIGIYGVMSYSVSQRRQEVGIRMALGAGAGQVLRLVLREAMVLAGAGIAVGVLLALIVTRLLGSLLFGVSATDPRTFAVTAVLLAGVALLASYLPARKAAAVDPVVALRND